MKGNILTGPARNSGPVPDLDKVSMELPDGTRVLLKKSQAISLATHLLMAAEHGLEGGLRDVEVLK